MTIATPNKTLFTPDELLRLPDAVNYELVDGQLVERNVSVESSKVASTIGRLLGSEANRTKSASVYGSDLGYQCFSDAPSKVRKPDDSVVKTERLSAVPPDAGYMPIVPDLAVEVVSPNDLFHDVAEKVEEYIAAGFPLVWVVDPKFRTVGIYRGDRTTDFLHADDEITGESALPTFRCKVSEFF